MSKNAVSMVLVIASSVLQASVARAQSSPPAEGDADAGAPEATTPPSEAPPAAAAPAATTAPPIALPARTEEASAPASWFARPPLSISVGQGDSRWRMTIYGFIEADVINDSTRSYSDSIGNSLVARNETYEGRVGRTQFSIRNTRLGFQLESPTIGGIKPTAILEADFFGNQPASTSEAAYFDSPGFRIRQAYLKLENPVIDLWAGQTYDLFGWQNYFFPASLEFLGLPNEAFGRTTQVRLAHTFRTDAVSVDLAVAALTPAQRDSEIPDGNAGVRFSINQWKGITTPGNGGTTALPFSIGVSGTLRQFKVNAFTPPPTQASNSAQGWGVSVDALVPIIPGKTPTTAATG